MRFCRLGLILFFVLSACHPAPSEPSEYQKNSFYPQDFKTPVSVLVQERNGQPFYMASGFLTNKEQGIFVTAKHFVDHLGGSDFKMFFNGKVYDGLVGVTPFTSDLALTGIEVSKFNLTDFPMALSLAESQLKVGDKVRVLGIHPHPLALQVDKVLVGIFGGYYNKSETKREFVFDQLEARVSNLALEIKNKDIEGTLEETGFISNTYIEIITAEDHQFSFAGLSGGPVINEKSEVIGVVSHGQTGGRQSFVEPFNTYKPWKILRLVPVNELKKIGDSISTNHKQ